MLFYDNFTQSIQNISYPNGAIQYDLGPADAQLKDKAGTPLTAIGLSVSNNSKWYVTDTKGSIVRINADTKEALPFHTSPNYSLGYNPGLDTAISSDGRFALVYMDVSKYLRIVDLSTCGPIPNTISGTPANCESKELTSALQNIPGFLGINQPKFINNNVISFYVGYKDANNVTRQAKYRMVAPGQSPAVLEYLGLGDSFSSGEGAYSYYPETDVTENKCHLSRFSYPYLIGQDLDYNSYKSIACSGATSGHIAKNAQYDYITGASPNPNNLGTWLPGSQRQLDLVQANQPNVITLTAGGNDIGFGDILKKCTGGGFVADTCFNSKEDRQELIRLVNEKFGALVDTYTKLKHSSKTDMKVYVAGYPKVAKDNSPCGNNVRLDSDEVKFSNLLVDYLNSVIQAAASKAGVRYVDVTDALTGHRLCETEYSNTAVNGLTAGNDVLGIIGNESYHPNAMGHRLLKSKILIETSNFTQSMPVANSAAAPPVESPSLPILNVPASGRSLKKAVFHSSLASDALFKDESEIIEINSDGAALKKNTSYTIELHSTPVSLGTHSTDANGKLTANITLPATVPTGFHTLHIFGQNLTNENIDIYKVVYVGATQNDLDGDGVANNQDACVSISPIGQDVDQDDVDDGCDGYINDSPTDINALYRARNGTIANGEDADSIYIERNVTKSASLLDITDVDSDSDGWVTVGKTAGATDGTVANYWIEDRGPQENRINKYIPHVSIRSAEQGCLQFKPSTLATVVDNSPREVTVEVENASTCRSAAATADTDNNGVADNQQTLYRARNGNTANGEDGDSVYIERNIAASEAILGISDYDANNDGWAVIAITDAGSDGLFEDLALVDPDDNSVISSTGAFTASMLSLSQEDRRAIIPVVAISQNSSCIGVKPASLSFVAQGENRTTSPATLPAEISCS